MTLCIIRRACLAALICPLASFAQYHNWSQVETALYNAQVNYPNLCRRVDLGRTVQNRTIWALCISDHPGTDEDEPEFRFISTMHGDEVVGLELCLYLIDYLTTNYNVDPNVRRLVDEVEIWIVPCMNPDGFVAGTRGNANGVDLNRSFPDPYTSPDNTPVGRQPETAVIMNWCFGRSFTLAANYHCGSLVVNYPFDANASGQNVYTPTPDDDLFVQISETYSSRNPPMWNSSSFYHGITNGADWYVIYGGLQDWSYRYLGANEVTIEVSSARRPPETQLPQFWNDNRAAMLAYMETCLSGVRGIVTDGASGVPLAATVAVVGRDHNVFTDPDVGDYHRMLLPGTYDLRFQSSLRDSLTVTNVPVASGDATRLDVQLWRTTVLAPDGGEVLRPHAQTTVSWSGNPIAQFHVQYTANASQTRTYTDGFESGTLDPSYATGGDAPWTVVTGSPHAGTRSARAGAITHNQRTWLTRHALAGPISFWYRVSSEASYDWFNFSVDGQQLVHRSGTVGWTRYTTTLGSGQHELRWEYAKDGSTSSGSDTVWIDDLSLVESATQWSNITALTPPGATTTPWNVPAPGNDYKVRVRSFRELDGFGPWDDSAAVFRVCLPGDLNGDGSVTATGDVPPLIAILLGQSTGDAYARCAADMSGDGLIDGDDVDGFVAVLLGS